MEKEMLIFADAIHSELPSDYKDLKDLF